MIILEHLMLKVLIIGDGDEDVKIFVGELILEVNIIVPSDRSNTGKHSGKENRPVDGKYLSVSTDVGELVIVRIRFDAATKANHKLHAL